MSEVLPEPEGEPVVEPAAEPAEQAWAPSQDEWDQIAGAVGYLAQLEQQRAQVYQPQQNGQQAPQLDPLADDFPQQLERYIGERMAPVQQYQTEAQLAEAEERAMDILGDLASKEGDFDKEVARLRADSLLPQMVQRYGNGPKAAEQALEEAAKAQRAYEQKQRERYVGEHTNHLATLSGAPHEPGSSYGNPGVQQRTMPDYTQGGTVTGRFFGRNSES